jgi:hypothetical protein
LHLASLRLDRTTFSGRLGAPANIALTYLVGGDAREVAGNEGLSRSEPVAHVS